MILCEIKLSGTWNYISNQDIMLSDSTVPWDSYVARFPNMQFGVKSDWGGLVSKSFGGITLKTALFTADPPMSAEIKIYHTLTNYADKTLIFEGYAHRKTVAPDVINYDLYPYPDTDTVKSAAYNDTLYNIVSAAATTLSLTFDGTPAQSPSPTVVYTTPSSDNLLLEELGKMTAFFDHIVWKNNGKLWLIYNDTDNGTAEVPYVSTVKYHDLVPPKKVSEARKSQEIVTSYTYGRTVAISPTCTGTASIALAAITAIKDRLLMPWANVTTQIDDLPAVKFGQRITWTDPDDRTVNVPGSFPWNISGWLRVRHIGYNLDAGQIIVSGEGGV